VDWDLREFRKALLVIWIIMGNYVGVLGWNLLMSLYCRGVLTSTLAGVERASGSCAAGAGRETSKHGAP